MVATYGECPENPDVKIWINWSVVEFCDEAGKCLVKLCRFNRPKEKKKRNAI